MAVAPKNWSVRQERAERLRERAVGIGEVQVLALAAIVLSVASVAHYYKWGQILLSGDAVAHINIARRVFDSRTPGLQQLGTVWLPLQHLLTIPFIISDAGWSSGIGGAIPSMAAFVFGVLGMFRLVRSGLAWIGGEDGPARVAAWIAAGIFAANPNLIYLQTTALNEPLSLALLIWATAFFTDFAQFALHGEDEEAARHLKWCGWLLMCDMLLRYDGWFYGAAFVAAAAGVVLVASRARLRRNLLGNLGRALATFVLINALAPALWFGYNAFLWGNPLEFATGRYSARAIAQRSRHAGEPHHPGWHSPTVATQHLVRNATLTLAETRRDPRSPSSWMEKTWVLLAMASIGLVLVRCRGLLPWLLLWLPWPFYAIAIAWGDVPIFIPQWWPFSYYNTRYGLQLLPAAAALVALLVYFAMTRDRSPVWRAGVAVMVCAFVALSYTSVWRNVPICLREIRVNGGPRYALDGRLGSLLASLPPSSTLLMFLGDHGGALERASIPMKRTINEGTKNVWDAALRAPAANADFVISGTGDPVAEAVALHPENLELLIVVQTAGQVPVRIYRSRH
ncbi:MAG: hypothetical protein LAN70_09740 [Acidobacteriia bacterium]|nr:hypothetical protein [Terriglobia bacterium]